MQGACIRRIMFLELISSLRDLDQFFQHDTPYTLALYAFSLTSTLSRPCRPCIVWGSVSDNTDLPNYWLSTQHEILHITFIKVQFKNIFKNIKLRKIL